MHNSKCLKSRIDFLKNFGIKDEEHVVMPGINGKMNEVQAAMGLINLTYVDSEMSKRENLVNIYREELSSIEGLVLPTVLPNVKSNNQYFVVRISEKLFGVSRDYVYEKLKEFNVYSRKYFYPLCSDYTCYRQLSSSSAENLPCATIIGTECLALPLYGELSEESVRKICHIIKNIPKGRLLL